MKKICLIGQFPPPIHGLSKALDTILHSEYLNSKYNLDYIDIRDNKIFKRNLKLIKRSEADIYYFTIAQTKLGNIRDLIILKVLLKKKKRVIIHYHGGYFKKLYDSMNTIQKKMNKRLINQIDLLIVLSESLKIIFEDVINSKKIRVCENYVEDNSLINIEDFNCKMEQLKSTKKTLKILYLSNFIESKGYKDVLNSAITMKDMDVEFHFAGAFFSEREEKDFLLAISQNELEKKVYYNGIINGEPKRELLLQSDIFVLPTYYPKEGQPISIIEAMGNGLAIITTNHAGIPDIVSKENGILINPRSSSEIVEAITTLFDRERLYKIANNNRIYTLKRYREIDYLQRLEMIFDEVLNYEN